MKALLMFLILIPTLLFSQQKANVIELAGKNSAELYSNAKEWLVLNPKSGNLFIQIDNPNDQKIIGTGVKRIAFPIKKYHTFIDVNYAIALHFRDAILEYSIYVKSVKYEDGFEISYDDFKSITTKKGWKTYLAKTNIKPVFNKKIITEGNRNAYSLLKKDLDGLISELTTYLRKGNQINW